MGWINAEDRKPPQGLSVLLEVSGPFSTPYSMIADHAFFIGCWLIPDGKEKGTWLIYDSSSEDNYHLIMPEVHAWMPLPKHYGQKEKFEQEPDMMEHAMFEDDPADLYTGDLVYEQMSLEEFFGKG